MRDSYLPQILTTGRIQPQELSYMFSAGHHCRGPCLAHCSVHPAWWALLPCLQVVCTAYVRESCKGRVPSLGASWPGTKSFQARHTNGVKLLLVPSPKRAQQGKVNATQPAGVCPLCPTQHTQRVGALRWALQRQLSAAEAASMKECKQGKQNCTEVLWVQGVGFQLFHPSPDGEQGAHGMKCLITFPLGFLTVKYEHHVYNQCVRTLLELCEHVQCTALGTPSFSCRTLLQLSLH